MRSTFALFLLAISVNTNAAFVFSDVSYTSNSFTFTIDGNMAGYDNPGAWVNQFAIVYGGDIFAGGTVASNNWVTGAFDNKALLGQGNTGGWEYDYTWSSFTTSLVDAVATSRQVTVNLASDYLNTAALDPQVTFIWGNIVGGSYTVLGEANLSAVPIPAAAWLFGTALAGLFGFKSRRRSSAKTLTAQ